MNKTTVNFKRNTLLNTIDQSAALKLGITEQMEKYINYDLELIQEEHENLVNYRK